MALFVLGVTVALRPLGRLPAVLSRRRVPREDKGRDVGAVVFALRVDDFPRPRPGAAQHPQKLPHCRVGHLDQQILQRLR